ncbi:MAG: hypothetical protein II661_03935 [Bacteroidales bacterium]|nr:hypothetical protein [Bacteroidales bacterium]
MKKKQKEKPTQEHLEPLVYRARPICCVNIAIAGALIVSFWLLFDSSILCVVVSVLLLMLAYVAFRHRNDCITLTEKGIGLDHVRVFEYGKKTERLDHVDIEWRYVRDVELYVRRQGYIDVNAHNKTYTVDLEYYMVFGTKLKSWQKAIKEYSQMPGTHIKRW